MIGEGASCGRMLWCVQVQSRGGNRHGCARPSRGRARGGPGGRVVHRTARHGEVCRRTPQGEVGGNKDTDTAMGDALDHLLHHAGDGLDRAPAGPAGDRSASTARTCGIGTGARDRSSSRAGSRRHRLGEVRREQLEHHRRASARREPAPSSDTRPRSEARSKPSSRSRAGSCRRWLLEHHRTFSNPSEQPGLI